MNKADWRLLEKIQAGSLSDDEAYLLEREEDAYALAQAGYILIIGPGKQGSPHEGKCCAIILKEGTDALEEYKEKQKEKKRDCNWNPCGCIGPLYFFYNVRPSHSKNAGRATVSSCEVKNPLRKNQSKSYGLISQWRFSSSSLKS